MAIAKRSALQANAKTANTNTDLNEYKWKVWANFSESFSLLKKKKVLAWLTGPLF